MERNSGVLGERWKGEIVRRPAAEMRSDTQRFSVSTQKRCVCRLGRKRRRFLLFA